METDDKLREELTNLLTRRKPPDRWTSMQDRIEQRSVEQRIHHLQNHLRETSQQEKSNET